MSRMDVLTENELTTLIDSSKLAKRYNEEIDRESAYELLNKKIEKLNKNEEVLKEKEAKIKEKRKPTSTRRKSTRMNPIVKVLTSATFIRGFLGVLKKFIK